VLRQVARRLGHSGQLATERFRLIEIDRVNREIVALACRAGTKTATAFGDKLSSKQANFQGKPYNGAGEGPSLKRAARVGSYPANPWGLHDMHGNEFEWCRDWYHARLPGSTDPDLYSSKTSATKSGNGAVSRVRRGGCWADEGWPCRSAFRLRFEPERSHDHIGFRVVAVRL